ncbi:Hypothetical predicted protein [Mytilus galloprovincialis]|uniref:Uncharacterized protein n=1 Tax=Mytilus galloprovincialis TaxID=29158 RepID=A0A8B6ETX7_MYTGA|nr:Hypothetical predicted protein [Mytilus galloprovincialis]
MDDLTVTTSYYIEAKWILLGLGEVVTWARMKFKPRKSRSMILRKGQIKTKFKLKIQGDEVSTLVDDPIKCLGKWFDDTLKDNTSVKTVQKDIGLYSRSSQLQLPLTSTLEECKVLKSRRVMTLRDSKDSKISKAGIQTRTGRKWSARTAVDQAGSILHHKDIVGNTCTGRQGYGMTHFQQWSKAIPKREQKHGAVRNKNRRRRTKKDKRQI